MTVNLLEELVGLSSTGSIFRVGGLGSGMTLPVLTIDGASSTFLLVSQGVTSNFRVWPISSAEGV